MLNTDLGETVASCACLAACKIAFGVTLSAGARLKFYHCVDFFQPFYEYVSKNTGQRIENLTKLWTVSDTFKCEVISVIVCAS